MPHNFAHFTNDMIPFIQQLQSGEITADQFRDAMQNVETQQQDPLDMGTGTGALSNLTDNTETDLLLGDKQSGGVQLQDANPTSVGTDYSQLQKGLGGVAAPKGYYFGPADGMYKYGEGPYADETKAYLDSVGMTFDEFSASQPQSSADEFGFDQFGMPIYYGENQDLDGDGIKDPVAQDLGPHGSPQPEPTQVFGSLGSAEQGEQYETFSDIIRQSAEDSGVDTYRKQLNRVTFLDPDTKQSYTYNFEKGEFEGIAPSGAIRNANLVAAQTGQDFREISGLSGLVPVSGLYEGEDDYFRFNISEEFQDPSKYDYSGALGQSPSEALAYAKELAKDDKSDNDLFYDYNGRTYVDVSGTGEGIPVGATNITRDPTQLGQYDSEGNYTKFDSSTYTSPVLDKTFDGYIASGSLGSGDIDGGLGDLDQSISPPATDSFLESIGTNTPYNIGKAFGLGDFILSSPPSNRFNLQPFFNQAESQGLDPFLSSQQRDTLQMIKDGNFFQALAGDPDTLAKYPTLTGQEGLNEVLNQLQGIDNDPTTPNTIDPSFQLDVFDTDSDSQVSSITGDDEGADDDEGTNDDEDPETPEATDPFVVRAYQGGGVGPFASNYIFQRFGYRPTETIDMLLRYDPVEELYFFENGQPVDPEFLQNMQLTKLDDEGQVVKDEEGNPVRMPKVVIEDDTTTDEEEE